MKSTQPRKHLKKRRNTGLPPGSIVYTGNSSGADVMVNYVEYDEATLKEESAIGTNFILHPSATKYVQWYDIRGLHDENLIRSVSEKFSMHPLAVEGAVDVYQRPNYTEYSDGHFISLRALSFNSSTKKLIQETLGIYMGSGVVLTFQEHDSDTLANIRERIHSARGRIRSRKADYLMYTMIDYVVDNYFQVLDQFEEEITSLELAISTDSTEKDKEKIYTLKKELLKVRKSIAPLREAINLFSRSDSDLIDQRTVTYIRDAYDHTIQVMDSVDSLRDILSGLQDLYISEISLKMNKIMQFLTVTTAVFVPLSFLTGLYGMNFEHIPELGYRNGYFILWAVMLVVVIGMLLFFKKKRWL